MGTGVHGHGYFFELLSMDLVVILIVILKDGLGLFS